MPLPLWILQNLFIGASWVSLRPSLKVFRLPSRPLANCMQMNHQQECRRFSVFRHGDFLLRYLCGVSHYKMFNFRFMATMDDGTTVESLHCYSSMGVSANGAADMPHGTCRHFVYDCLEKRLPWKFLNFFHREEQAARRSTICASRHILAYFLAIAWKSSDSRESHGHLQSICQENFLESVWVWGNLARAGSKNVKDFQPSGTLASCWDHSVKFPKAGNLFHC